MARFVVVGTDTDAGKTTFSSLWLAAFPTHLYWKPLETGVSDTETVQERVPDAICLLPLQSYPDAVAPFVAAQRHGDSIPLAADIAHAAPMHPDTIIETFGGPCSPLNETESQLELLRAYGLPLVLVTSSSVGAIGRTLAMLRVLRSELLNVQAVVLLGVEDTYAAKTIAHRGSIAVHSLPLPTTWDAKGFQEAATQARATLQALHEHLTTLHTSHSNLIERDAASVWHPYTSLRDTAPPLPVVGAQDEFLRLADGRQLIDAVSSWWTILHGHRDPRLMKALLDAAQQIDHVLFAGVTHPYAVEVAESLLATCPWEGGRVFFSDNGSTAVEVALKMAYQYWHHHGYPERTLFIGFENGYHGDTFGAMAVGRDPLFFGTFEPLLFRVQQVPVSPDALDAVLRQHASKTAAVIIEPLVQGAGGMQMHDAATLAALHRVAKQHGVLFIADEVMTCGRTGRFWAHEGITPDLICASKTLAGGLLPLAVTLAGPNIVAAFDTADRTKTFFHGHSFTAHPLACAVAAANLRLMADDGWQRESKRIAAYWHHVTPTLQAQPNVVSVRQTGTILAVEVQASGGYLANVGHAMRSAAIAKGVLLRPLGNVLYALPPLCTSDTSLAQIVEAMYAALAASTS